MSEFVSSLEAKLLEREVIAMHRSVESGVEPAVVTFMHINKQTAIHNRVALWWHIRHGGFFNKCEVVVAIAPDSTLHVLSCFHAPWLVCKQLQINTQFRVCKSKLPSDNAAHVALGFL